MTQELKPNWRPCNNSDAEWEVMGGGPEEGQTENK